MLIEPRTEAEVAEAVAAARAAKAPLAIEGGGTKRGLGRPVQAERTLSLKGLSGITLYEPAEMVIGALAGTPLAEVLRTLDERGQMLAFEPPDYRQLLGSTGEPTIGSLVATGLAGPRRVFAGGLRDSLIGLRFINGRGETIKNGGRVMKNVTGLDLVKLQAGAHGTLGVLTEAIFKVVPKPAAEATLAIEGLTAQRAIAAMAAALGSPFEITGAAHEAGRTFLRLEGFPEQIAYRSAELRARLKDFGALGALPDDAGRWTRIGAGGEIAQQDLVWRASVKPSEAAAFAGSLGLPCLFDWGAGLVLLGAPNSDGLTARIQAAAARHGGHATLLKAPPELRASVDVFQPLAPGVMKLQAGLKASFDPDGILNPGRMYAGV
jgi:glycolate oxidase FAD binding subunit